MFHGTGTAFSHKTMKGYLCNSMKNPLWQRQAHDSPRFRLKKNKKRFIINQGKTKRNRSSHPLSPSNVPINPSYYFPNLFSRDRSLRSCCSFVSAVG